jgi:hypothetical protein
VADGCGVVSMGRLAPGGGGGGGGRRVGATADLLSPWQVRLRRRRRAMAAEAETLAVPRTPAGLDRRWVPAGEASAQAPTSQAATVRAWIHRAG